MLLDKIKQQTAENHAAMENSNLMKPVMNRELNLESYRKILIKFYGFFQPLENSIHRFTDILNYLPDLETRRKSSTIKEDLQRLGYKSEINLCTDLPEITTSSQAMGCLYVMEGSTLGGRMISRIIKESLLIEMDSGVSFFSGYGEETGKKWKLFCEALKEYSLAANDDNTIINAANETFIKFKNWVESEPNDL
ncbi:heme oxygenase [Sporocytophaga myxococcoides]|uniref:Heme oxygenase n=1 Tax=Sporocytophaga myxococcoides TaxID=153721 RepID=A0A098LG19_9BACT|nr:biliverdin-producing heme oxygenase [Sporocytophaga myxococcoides]GAL85382.1 heme oxygenase [Sporocytophaga myxococcoides]